MLIVAWPLLTWNRAYLVINFRLDFGTHQLLRLHDLSFLKSLVATVSSTVLARKESWFGREVLQQ